MIAEILSIGDELLIGQTVNTNASWIGQELSKIGARVIRVSTISDDKNEIFRALRNLHSDTNCLIITGGLGPTKDDITKHTLCDYFETELEIHQPTLEKIQSYFAARNRPILESNNQQAALPKDSIILTNNYGTASGMWFERNGVITISLPGVPYEMKGIMTEEVFPRLKSKFNLKAIYHKTALTQGIGESFLAEKIKDWEDRIREEGFSLAYLPSPGMVKLRITSYNGTSDSQKIDSYFEELKLIIPEALWGFEQDTLPEVIGRLLTQKCITIGTIESCTGGLLANTIISNPGASNYYIGSLITYSNDQKHRLANVSIDSILTYGVVSEEVAIEMANGAKEKLGVDICIATTGIAGPNGGTLDKPVGLVWVAIAFNHKTVSRKFNFGDNRERNMQMTSLSALNWLRFELENL
jgi:nicotinamide-nucleotide amidase